MTEVKNKIAYGVGLLKKYIHDKLAVDDYTNLSEEEKKTYDQWHDILTKELTLDNLKNFLAKQNVTLGKELREAVEKGEDRKALKIAARMENYEAIVIYLSEPERSRDALINQLKSLVGSN